MTHPELHFTRQVWRPPYEANSQLLQITSGCTWHKCKFCSLYHGTPFRISPLSEVEEDLKVIRQWQPRARRVYDGDADTHRQAEYPRQPARPSRFQHGTNNRSIARRQGIIAPGV